MFFTQLKVHTAFCAANIGVWRLGFSGESLAVGTKLHCCDFTPANNRTFTVLRFINRKEHKETRRIAKTLCHFVIARFLLWFYIPLCNNK